MAMKQKEERRKKRHGRIRKRLSGSPERPRLAVRRSLKNLYAQVVDDQSGRTLYSFSTRDKDFVQAEKTAKGKTAAAALLGQVYAPILKQKGIQKIAFDRAGYQYHGRVKAFADSLRQNGIEF
jgi:large subunit ribosomal protein L18